MRGDVTPVGTGRAQVPLQTTRRWRSRPVFWVGVILVAASGVYVVITAVRLGLVCWEMMEAKADLLEAEAALRQDGLGVSGSRSAEAETRALDARSQFRSAQSFLEDEPLLWLAGRVPLLGHQVDAAAALAGIGYDGSEIALSGVEVLDTFDSVAAENDATMGERTVAFLEAVRPEMQAVDERLESIHDHRRALDGALLPPLAGLASEVDRYLPQVEELVRTYQSGDAMAADLLGYQGPRTYLILGQDNTELMPGGGLIGVYGLVTLERGELTQSTFADAGDLIETWQEESGGEYVEPPGPLKRYLLRDWTWNIAVANWSPHFPTAARRVLFFYERAGGGPVDGVITLDFTTLEGLLAVLGPADIDGYDVTVSADNVTEETLIRTRTEVRPGEGKHAFAVAVASRVVEEALTASPDDWGPLLETLDRLAAQKHIAVYSRVDDVQASLRELGWTGEVRDAPGDYLQVVEASVHSTKLNLLVEERMDVDIRLDDEGGVEQNVTLHYENGFPSWAQGRDPDLVYDLMLSGFYGDYVRLLAPADAALEGITLDGREVGAEEIKTEVGKASFGRYMPLPKGDRATLAFNYEVPAAVIVSQGVYEYRLLIQKQAGVQAMPLSVGISPPTGASVQSVSLDGRRLDDRPLSIETELDRDHELVIRYR